MNDIDDQGPGPPQFNFANQFKWIPRMKLKVFVLRDANSGPHLTFLWT